MAADQGYKVAQCHLGLLFLVGHGVVQSDEEAVKWLRRAADQDYVDAQYILGMLVAQGRGVGKSYMEAKRWFKKASKQGQPFPRSILTYGCINQSIMEIDTGNKSGGASPSEGH